MGNKQTKHKPYTKHYPENTMLSKHESHKNESELMCVRVFFCLIWCQYIEYLLSIIVSYLQQLVLVMVEKNETSGFTRGVSDNAHKKLLPKL
jgi:hypothetical protein